ncbi:MAG: hypothetical protein HY774_02875 [Acidobacteria bacterium]|nr:hypothetical protein [Acidobacteriota bacterium]
MHTQLQPMCQTQSIFGNRNRGMSFDSGAFYQKIAEGLDVTGLRDSTWGKQGDNRGFRSGLFPKKSYLIPAMRGSLPV